MDTLRRLSIQLSQRKEQGILRLIPNLNPDAIDFSSNDYLGLSRNPSIIQSVHRRITEDNPKLGTGGSRLLAGNTSLHSNLEIKLADIHQGEKALLFNNGYMANLGVFSCIPHKGDTILYDEHIHACVKDGIRLSNAQHFSFRHNDLTHLNQKLQKAEGEIFVAIESLYSMDGDVAPLHEMVSLCEHYGAHLIVDEAHSTGIYGPSGAGSCVAMGVENEIFARVHTFGKAIGSHGACVVASEIAVDFLTNFSRPFIYTTSMPVHQIIAIEEAYTYLDNHADESLTLLNRIRLFKKLIPESEPHCHGPIQIITVPDNHEVKRVAAHLQSNKIDVRPILSPTVRAGSERLRICLHAYNTEDEITLLAEKLHEVL